MQRSAILKTKERPNRLDYRKTARTWLIVLMTEIQRSPIHLPDRSLSFSAVWDPYFDSKNSLPARTHLVMCQEFFAARITHLPQYFPACLCKRIWLAVRHPHCHSECASARFAKESTLHVKFIGGGRDISRLTLRILPPTMMLLIT